MRRWTDEEDKILQENYGKISMKDLRCLLKRSDGAIYSRVKKFHLVGSHSLNRKYERNDNYFSVPNLENSYWAGFLAADGGIIKDLNHTELIKLLKEVKVPKLKRKWGD